jgi:hypothetical protein
MDTTGTTFSTDWFSQRAPLWETHLRDLKGRANLRYLEIGAFEGRSLVWVLENILTHPSSRAYVIDPFTGSAEHASEGYRTNELFTTFQHNTEAHRHRVVTHVGWSHRVLRSAAFAGLTFDLIYVDGSHRAADAFVDGVLAWSLLAPDGVIVFDDYLWDVMPGVWQRPKLGVDVFAWIYGGQYDVVFRDYQVALSRRGSGPEGTLSPRVVARLFYPLAMAFRFWTLFTPGRRL